MNDQFIEHAGRLSGVSEIDIPLMWDAVAEKLSDEQGYTLRPDDPRYPQDRTAIEDAVMDVLGFDPDWREL